MVDGERGCGSGCGVVGWNKTSPFHPTVTEQSVVRFSRSAASTLETVQHLSAELERAREEAGNNQALLKEKEVSCLSRVFASFLFNQI